MDRLNCALYR